MRKVFIITTALMLSAAPAHAQLLGGGLGGGIGGSLGGSIGGTLGGTLNDAGSVGSAVDSVRSSTSGTLSGAGSSNGSQSVNRRTGQVHADRSANGSTGTTVSQALATPTHAIGGGGSGNASGSGSGSVDGQLIGTDALRGTAHSLRGTAGGVVPSAEDAGGGALGSIGGLTSSLSGTLSGSGSASGSGAGGGTLGPVSGSDSADGSGSGGFQVTRGMPVIAPDGDRIGKVRQLFTNGRGEVQQMLVKVGDNTALLPASNFSASGNGVISAMTASQIQQTAAQQQAAGAQAKR